METLCSASVLSNSKWMMEEDMGSTNWTREENKRFESALAIFDERTPDRWAKVAAMIPGKSVADVVNQYLELVADVTDIEAGLVPIPGYLTSSFTLEWVDGRGFGTYRKRSSSGQFPDQERKKGVPWTEEEHRLFLMGLQKHGKGDWRNISRNFVISKTPAQVASHAQKFYLRQQLSGGKDKRRPSIHDITMVHLNDTVPSDDNEKSKPSGMVHMQKSSVSPKILLDWKNRQKDAAAAVMVLGSAHGGTNPYELASHGFQWQRAAAHLGLPSSEFQMRSRRYQIHG